MTAELYDLEVGDLLRAARPVPDLAPDWDEVLRRGTRTRRRGLLLAAALVAVLAVAVGASLAAVGELPWWESAEPASPTVVDRQLGGVHPNPYGPPNPDQKLARTIVRIDGATLVAAPVGRKGGYCLVPSLKEKADLGSSCTYQTTDSSWALARGEGAARWILYGRFVDPQAASLDLSAAAGEPFIVPLRPGGFFLVAVPRHLWARLDGGAGAARVLDASGAAINAGCVQWHAAPASTQEDSEKWPFYASGHTDNCRPAPPLPPRPARIDTERAERLVAFHTTSPFGTYPSGTELAVWRAPANDGWVCTFVEAAPLPRELFGMGGGGGSCVSRTPPPPTGEPPIRSEFSVGPAGVFDGQVSRDAGIARMGFRSAAGEVPLAFENGFFIGQLPDGDVHAGVLPSGGPFVIVGYGVDGKVVASLDVEKTIRRASGGGSS